MGEMADQSLPNGPRQNDDVHVCMSAVIGAG